MVTGLTANFWRLPDADLKPQTVNTAELIVSYLLTSNIALSINGFYNNVDDIISSQGYTGEAFHGIPVTFIERPINKGEATTYGGTAFITYKLHLSKYKLNSYLAYTYIDGEIDGKPIPFSAKNTIKGGLDIKLKNISLSPRFIYRSKSKHRSLTDENGERLTNDPFTLVNLMARYDITTSDKMHLSIYFKISNLLNSKYYNLPIGGSESLAGSPQDPIRINLGAEVQF
jgi:iron complex outermembrane receptor protein